MSNITDEEEPWMLKLPDTFPDNGRPAQYISVIEDVNAQDRDRGGVDVMHVNLFEVMDYAESWGSYLADVARVIARDYADCLHTNREDGDLFAALCDGFAANAHSTLVAALFDSFATKASFSEKQDAE
jgi:hypothetical protein